MTRQEMLNKIYEKINFPYDDGDAVYSPVMIGDVLHYRLGDLLYEGICIAIGKLWTAPREPLDKQSDDCIQYVYSLI